MLFFKYFRALFIIAMMPVSVGVCTIIDAYKWSCKPIYFDGFKGCPFVFNIKTQIHNVKRCFD